MPIAMVTGGVRPADFGTGPDASTTPRRPSVPPSACSKPQCGPVATLLATAQSRSARPVAAVVQSRHTPVGYSARRMLSLSRKGRFIEAVARNTVPCRRGYRARMTTPYARDTYHAAWDALLENRVGRVKSARGHVRALSADQRERQREPGRLLRGHRRRGQRQAEQLVRWRLGERAAAHRLRCACSPLRMQGRRSMRSRRSWRRALQ
jgi:hypothetical protein